MRGRSSRSRSSRSAAASTAFRKLGAGGMRFPEAGQLPFGVRAQAVPQGFICASARRGQQLAVRPLPGARAVARAGPPRAVLAAARAASSSVGEARGEITQSLRIRGVSPRSAVRPRTTRSRCRRQRRAARVPTLPVRVRRPSRRGGPLLRRAAIRRTAPARRLRRTRCAPAGGATATTRGVPPYGSIARYTTLSGICPGLPGADQLERRADDANEVAAVLPAEVRPRLRGSRRPGFIGRARRRRHPARRAQVPPSCAPTRAAGRSASGPGSPCR